MKISIIVPVYLSEAFLDKNFDNLVNQSYKNLEIIYVNDGSPDSSPQICNGFAIQDKRVKVIHQINGGAAEALNSGIRNATGDYIMFLDADDWIELNTCEVAIDTILKNEVDLVFWLNIKEYPNKSVPVLPFFDKAKVFKEEDMCFLKRRMIGLVGQELAIPMSTDAFNAGWGKLYRTSVIKDNNIKWTDTNYVGSSDIMFNSHLMPFLNSAYYINDYLHHYNRDNPNSLTKTYDDTLLHKFSNLFKELRLTIEKNYSNSKEYNTFLEALDNRIALSTINIGLGYVSKGLSLKGFKKFKSLLLSDTYQKALKKLKTNYLPLHFRTFFILCKHGVYSPAYFLLNIMQKLRQND